MQPMMPEERFERIERSMEFLLQQQAQWHSDLRKLEEQTAKLAEQTARNSDQINQLALQMGQLSGALMQVTEELSRRMEAGFSQVNRPLERLAQHLDRLAQAQIHTDERLNIVINIVERYFSNGHQH